MIASASRIRSASKSWSISRNDGTGSEFRARNVRIVHGFERRPGILVRRCRRETIPLSRKMHANDCTTPQKCRVKVFIEPFRPVPGPKRLFTFPGISFSESLSQVSRGRGMGLLKLHTGGSSSTFDLSRRKWISFSFETSTTRITLRWFQPFERRSPYAPCGRPSRVSRIHAR